MVAPRRHPAHPLHRELADAFNSRSHHRNAAWENAETVPSHLYPQHRLAGCHQHAQRVAPACARGMLVLVWDGLPAHRSRETKAFLKTRASWLTVHRFPAYAPELNPMEYLRAAGKNKELTNLCVDTINDIDTHIRSYKRRVQRQPRILTGFLKKSGLFETELST